MNFAKVLNKITINMKNKMYFKYLQFFLLFLFFTSFYGCGILFSKKELPKIDKGMDPEKAFVYYVELYNNGDYESALKVLDQIIATFPEEKHIIAWCYYEKGFIYYRLKKSKEAKEYMEKILKEYSDTGGPAILASKILNNINQNKFPIW